MNPPAPAASRVFHVMAKPMGPACNLHCTYCFYVEKEALFPAAEDYRMSEALLETFTRDYLAAAPGPAVNFAWQGGEPMMRGLAFFRRAVELQKKYAAGRPVTNALQTNGTLLDDAWGEFLAREKFLVGLSLDGPADLHNRYRVSRGGRPSFDEVMRGLGLLKAHGVEFNTLTTVTREASRRGPEIYRFLRDAGSAYLQFIPIVERAADPGAAALGLDLAGPPRAGSAAPPVALMPWSVEPKAYGDFLSAIFDEWVRRDVGTVFVNLFEVALSAWVGQEPSLCVFSRECGNALVLEHNGDLYACDHFVYPEHRRGNITERPLGELAALPAQQAFGRAKAAVPRYCRQCAWFFACHGECPKHRFLRAPDGEEGLNYLCAGLKRFFQHADPALRAMAALLKQHRPAAEIMQARAVSAAGGGPARNAPCPCGSGRKFKQCCGK